ncbi:MAG TPA: hypothetical protein VKU40_07765 [Thermoanaerobaculia bacterium]|nr:hypothetical protein [Thermoanaerobaculia bacterium]
MKTTSYFEANRDRPDRRMIEDRWIERVLTAPLHRKVQNDGRIRLWGRVEEAKGRFLRVVVLEDGETVHNAFFDRRFKVEDE